MFAVGISKTFLLTGAVIAVYVLGCADNSTRQNNYPRELHYIDEITQAMQQLSFHMQQLDDLARAKSSGPQARSEILANLNGMERAAARLQTSGWPSSHPPFDTKLDNFRRDITLAWEAAERDPPDYSMAMSLQQACVYCHKGQ